MTTRTKLTRESAGSAVRTLLRPDEFADVRREWLAEGLLVAGAPAVMAGGRIELSWFATDLAVSLATGTPFLGHFPTTRRRVALYCYDTAFADVATLARTVAAARGTDLAASDLRLARRGTAFRTRAEWQGGVAETRGEGVEVVVIDPVRVALRTGETGETESEVERLAAVGDAFLAAGVTPVFTHGTTRASDTLRLADLGTAGLGDYVRQWAFVSRLRPVKQFGPDAFRLTAGGFAGHAGEWGVRVKCGRLDRDFGGLTWAVSVSDAAGLPAATRDTTLVPTTADIAAGYAELEEKAAAKRGRRLTQAAGTSAPRPTPPPAAGHKAAPTVFSFE